MNTPRMPLLWAIIIPVHTTPVCLAHPHPSARAQVLGLHKLVEYARSVPAHELLLVSDSDVVFNGIHVDAAAVAHRFERARVGPGGSDPPADVVFQSEPWCWAPTSQRDPRTGRTHDALGCTPETLRRYETMGSEQSSWRCARFLNAGAYIGSAAAIARFAHLWSQPALWTDHCRDRAHYKVSDQCIATWIRLLGNVSIALDQAERLFATVGYALPGAASSMRRPDYTVPCGRARCHVSLLFNESWRTAADGRLHRASGTYQRECRTATAPPLLIHGNGPAKKIMKGAEMKAWLARSYPL